MSWPFSGKFKEVRGSFFQVMIAQDMVEWISIFIHIYIDIWIFIDIMICDIHIKLQGMATLMQLTGSRADQLILWTGRCCFDHFSSTWGILAETCCTFHSQHWKEDMACYISQMIFVHDFGESNTNKGLILVKQKTGAPSSLYTTLYTTYSPCQLGEAIYHRNPTY